MLDSGQEFNATDNHDANLHHQLDSGQEFNATDNHDANLHRQLDSGQEFNATDNHDANLHRQTVGRNLMLPTIMMQIYTVSQTMGGN